MKTEGKVGLKEKTINRYRRVILYGLMVFSLVVGLSAGVSAGAGIRSCSDLRDMKNDLSGDYYLENDIDCSGTATWNGGAGFEPVGDLSNKFTGTFDGNYYVITDLYINRPSTDYVGLFGYTGGGFEIENVGLKDVDVSGNDYIGGLVGYVSESEGAIYNSYSTGSVNGGWYVGGLVGYNHGAIHNSYSTGSVIGAYYGRHAGGLVGQNYYGVITNSYSTGSVIGESRVGGLVGSNYGAIYKSYSTGNVSGNSYVGGFVGWNLHGTILQSFWDTETSGQTTSVRGTGKTTAEMKTRSTFTDVGWDFCPEGNEKIWAINDGQSYPCLNWQQPGCTCYPCGDGNLDPGEQCDDGNNRDGDWCSSACKVPWGRPILVVVATLVVVGSAIWILERIGRYRHRRDN